MSQPRQNEQKNRNRQKQQQNNNRVEFAEEQEINDADQVVKKLLERDNNPDRC